jgi:hypothetical protein
LYAFYFYSQLKMGGLISFECSGVQALHKAVTGIGASRRYVDELALCEFAISWEITGSVPRFNVLRCEHCFV